MRGYPWGDDWIDKTDEITGKHIIEERLNWQDKHVVSKKTMEPTTMAVDSLPEGRSWCGCFHMLGNVAVSIRCP